MKKVGIHKFNSQNKLITKLTKVQQQTHQQTRYQKQLSSRFSCQNAKKCWQDRTLVCRNNFSQMIELPNTQQNLLRSILQSNQKKRLLILNNLIGYKHKNLKPGQDFRNIRKIKTQQKEKSLDNTDSDRYQTFYKNMMTSKLANKKDVFSAERSLLSQRKKTVHKLSYRQSELLKSSFSKRIKQIKLRKYFQKDEIESSPLNFFQSCAASIQGQKHEQNQDSIYFSQGIYILCDGHGSNGKQVSEFIAQSIHHALHQLRQEQKIDQTAILQAYHKIDLQLENSNLDCSFSGCTCVALLRYQNSLFCISLGDSRAIIAKGCNVTELSISHKPQKPCEKDRIQSYGGIVKQIEVAKDKFAGPMRIWAPGKNSWGPGLALSRAFGDKAARKYGLISIPEVRQIKLTSDEQFIVLGSDGLFDYFSDNQICSFIRKLLKDGLAKEEIANQLVKEAKKRWPFDSDDASCIIVFI